MPAVVRVKRRIDEEPQSAFVLNGKKRRIDESNVAGGSTETTQTKDDLSTVLKFAGTIAEQDDAATKQIATRLSKDAAKQLVQQKTTSRQQQFTSATERSRREIRQAQSEQRFRVVNCQRTILNEDDSLAATSMISAPNADNVNNTTSALQQSGSAKETVNSAVTILDIEPDSVADNSNATQVATAAVTPHTSELPADSDTGYVYDLYVPENEEEASYVDLMDDNYISVRLYDNLTVEDCFEEEDPDYEYDSEDSNQENYFANEYPDEDMDMDMFDQGYDDDLIAGIHNFRLRNDDDDEDFTNEYSSSENFENNDDDFVHFSNSNNVHDDDESDDGDYNEEAGSKFENNHKRLNNKMNNCDKKETKLQDDVDNDVAKEKSNSLNDEEQKN